MTLSEIEADLGVQFPDAYRALQIPQEGACLLALDDVWQVPGSADVAYCCREARETDGFPLDGAAIALNGCGDYLFLRSGGRSALGTTVYRFDHETTEVYALGELPGALAGLEARDRLRDLLRIVAGRT